MRRGLVHAVVSVGLLVLLPTGAACAQDMIDQLDLKSDEFKKADVTREAVLAAICLLYTSPSPRDGLLSRMPSSA